MKEVLGMFDNDPTEMFIRDLIDLLPKIMGKLQHIVEQLREEDGTQNREAVKLLLDLLNAIFNWKGFQSATHHGLLQGNFNDSRFESFSPVYTNYAQNSSSSHCT